MSDMPLMHKDFLALQQVVMAIKAEKASPGYIEDIRGVANMAHVSVDVDTATWSLLDHFQSQIDRTEP